MNTTRCQLCGQIGNKNCCVWRLYYRTYKNQDWTSTAFKEFNDEIQAQLKVEVRENEQEEGILRPTIMRGEMESDDELMSFLLSISG